MPSTHARRLCPHAVFLPGDHDALRRGQRARCTTIFRDVTPLVEPLVARRGVPRRHRRACACSATAPTIARRSARAVADELAADVLGRRRAEQVPRQAGVRGGQAEGLDRRACAPGRGVVEVRPGGELAFLHPLPVQALWGVGPATLERLQRLGVRTVGDLAALDEATLVAALGKRPAAATCTASPTALDDRPVEPDRAVKSIGHEETFATDLTTIDELRTELVRLADGVAAPAAGEPVRGRTVTLKVRFAGFPTITRSTTLPSPLATGAVDRSRPSARLLEALDPTPGVRLLGVSGSNLDGAGRAAQPLDGSDRRRGSRPTAGELERHWQRGERGGRRHPRPLRRTT